MSYYCVWSVVEFTSLVGLAAVADSAAVSVGGDE